jgi:DNA-binding NarL/FixJ family response regulator
MQIESPRARTRARFAELARRAHGVTPGEAEVLLRVVCGQTDPRAIAASRRLTPAAVRSRLRSARERLGAADRTAAVVRLWPLYRRAKMQL